METSYYDPQLSSKDIDQRSSFMDENRKDTKRKGAAFLFWVNTKKMNKQQNKKLYGPDQQIQ